MDTHNRTLAKAITWRIIATLIAAYFTGISVAILLNIVQTVAYYIHERVWLKVDWGRNNVL